MPVKKEILAHLDANVRPTFSKAEVKCFVNSVSSELGTKPSKLKRGDVYVCGSGGKKRPVVICKVLKGMVLGIPLSTTEDELNLCSFKSRFMGENFFGKQVVVSTYDHAMENFSGVFDNNGALNKAVKLMKQFYSDVL